jgi:hypothetical protein
MKEGQSLSSRAQGGVLCAPKNKKTKYYEIRRKGKTKLSHTFSENKLNFNLKKREFTRFRPLSLAACSHALSLMLSLHSCSSPSFLPFSFAHHPSRHQPSNTTQQLPIDLVSINDQPLSIN